jgi:two-component system response regulator YesN
LKEKILSVLFIGTSKKISQLLRHIINEDIYSIVLNELPQDLKKAESCIAARSVDLIILEISKEFPVWEFMDNVLSAESHPEILLISKEKSFDLTYQAFQHRAFNFLLEPVSQEMLIQTFEEVKGKLRLVEEMEQDRQRLDLYELKQHQELMEKILTNMLEKPEELETLLWEVNHRYQTELQNDNFQAIVINADKQELYYEKSGFSQKVLSLIEHAFPKAHEVISAIVMPYGITGIINFSYAQMREIEVDMKNLYDEIMALKQVYGEFEIAIGVGTLVHSMKEVNLSLQEALRAEQYKLVLPNQKIFYSTELVSRPNGMNGIIVEAQKKNLARLLKGMDEEGLKLWFSEILQRTKASFIDYPEGYSLIKETMLSTAKEIWNEESDQEFFEDEMYAINQLNHIFQGTQMLQQTMGLLIGICRRRKQTRQTQISKPIQEAMDFIHAHFNEAITLEELSEVCSLSPNYFSAMFKEQVGETYIDYLTEYRMEQGKKMLLETQKTVKDIANEIGYLDDKYFRKLFKNRFGNTPVAYRASAKE